MIYKIELSRKRRDRGCKGGVVTKRFVIEASDMDMAAIDARGLAGPNYRHAEISGLAFNDDEIANREAASQRFLNYRDMAFVQRSFR